MAGWLSIYLKGVFMGAADAVPGVSGGTIALITGIYERLVTAIASFDPRIAVHAVRVHDPDERAKVREMLDAMDLPFLVVLAAGVLTAVVAVTRVIDVALARVPALVFAFFFGLIAASAVVLRSEVGLDTRPEQAAGVVGFLVAFVVAGVSAGGGLGHGPLFLFASGAVAISAMVLPGVSGSFLLVLLGQYAFMVSTLHGFIDALVVAAGSGGFGAAAESGRPLVAFLLGVAVGIVTFAHVVSWALSNYRDVTLTFLVALMVGALRYPAARVLAETGAWTASNATGVLVAALAGAAAVLVVDRYTDGLDYA